MGLVSSPGSLFILLLLFSIVKLLLNNGKHILCEKPLGMNVKETKEMLDLAKEKNLFLMEAIWSRVQPSYLKLKEEIDKGLIGEVSHVQAKLYIPSTIKTQMNYVLLLFLGRLFFWAVVKIYVILLKNPTFEGVFFILS